MRARGLKTVIFLVAVVFFSVAVAIASDLADRYDLNTEITVSGRVTSVLEGMRGPRMFVLDTGVKEFHVITGPYWYHEQIGFDLKEGITLEVTGSKLYDRKGILYIIAHSIKDTGTGSLYHFRDENFRPLWREGRGRTFQNK